LNNCLEKLQQYIFPLGIPLPWRQLIRDRKRFATACAGITAAVVLMMYQLGLYRGFTEKVVFPHSTLAADLVLISRNYDYYYAQQAFPIDRLYQALASSDVQAAMPMYVAQAYWSVPETGITRYVTLYGIELEKNPFTLPEVRQQLQLLRQSDTILYDALSHRDFGQISQQLAQQPQVDVQIEGKRLRVKGLFNMGQTFIGLANAIISDNGFFTLFPNRPRTAINFGLLQLHGGRDPRAVSARLQQLLPGDVRVVTMQEFINMERAYWLKKSPIGIILIAGLLLAVSVGAAIVYQILYTDVNDHIKEYATLKALGVDDAFFSQLIIKQALILLFFSFPGAMLLTSALYGLTRLHAQYPLHVTWQRAVLVFTLAFLMCLLAGAMATRKLKRAEPAEIFYG